MAGDVVVSFPEAEVARLLAVSPWAATGADRASDQVLRAVTGLVAGEESRRGGRDGLTSVLTVSGLRHGALIQRPEHRGGSPGDEAIELQIVAIDVRGFVLAVDHHGFAPTDRALERVASAFAARFPGRWVVRMGGDSFAAIAESIPCGRLFDRASLEADLATALAGPPEDRLDPAPSQFTIVELELAIRGAHDSTVVGALVAAEIDRALSRERAEPRGEPYRRYFDLDP